MIPPCGMLEGEFAGGVFVHPYRAPCPVLSDGPRTHRFIGDTESGITVNFVYLKCPRRPHVCGEVIDFSGDPDLVTRFRINTGSGGITAIKETVHLRE